MVPSSALCRAQEGLHLRKAADTALENVRLVATNAAAAWGKEAVAAECREARQLRARTLAEAGIAARNDLSPNENPDRDRATPRPFS